MTRSVCTLTALFFFGGMVYSVAFCDEPKVKKKLKPVPETEAFVGCACPFYRLNFDSQLNQWKYYAYIYANESSCGNPSMNFHYDNRDDAEASCTGAGNCDPCVNSSLTKQAQTKQKTDTKNSNAQSHKAPANTTYDLTLPVARNCNHNMVKKKFLDARMGGGEDTRFKKMGQRLDFSVRCGDETKYLAVFFFTMNTNKPQGAPLPTGVIAIAFEAEMPNDSSPLLGGVTDMGGAENVLELLLGTTRGPLYVVDKSEWLNGCDP